MTDFALSQLKGFVLAAILVASSALFDWAFGSFVPKTVSYGQAFGAAWAGAATAFWINCP